jgi:hypothetical protein
MEEPLHVPASGRLNQNPERIAVAGEGLIYGIAARRNTWCKNAPLQPCVGRRARCQPIASTPDGRRPFIILFEGRDLTILIDFDVPPASDYLSCYLILIDMVRGR